MNPPVYFYFDYISPYAYLAWTQVHSVIEKHGRSIEYVPVLFAGLLNAYGHKGPAEIPPKRLYVANNVTRIAHSLGIALKPPPSHPFNPLLALRITSMDMPNHQKRTLIDRLFRATWADGIGVTDENTVKQILESAGFNGTQLIEYAKSDNAKAAVKHQTDTAIAAGVFGVPTMLVESELFWGFDSLPHLDQYLGGQDPVTEAHRDQWKAVTPSAVRIPK